LLRTVSRRLPKRDAILHLFAAMRRQRITHGDLKAMNLLWHAARSGSSISMMSSSTARQRRIPAPGGVTARACCATGQSASALYRWLDDQLAGLKPSAG
jgi:hypothetical protein